MHVKLCACSVSSNLFGDSRFEADESLFSCIASMDWGCAGNAEEEERDTSETRRE